MPRKKSNLPQDGITKHTLSGSMQASKLKKGMTIYLYGSLCKIRNIQQGPKGLEHIRVLSITGHPNRDDFSTTIRDTDLVHTSINGTQEVTSESLTVNSHSEEGSEWWEEELDPEDCLDLLGIAVEPTRKGRRGSNRNGKQDLPKLRKMTEEEALEQRKRDSRAIQSVSLGVGTIRRRKKN